MATAGRPLRLALWLLLTALLAVPARAQGNDAAVGLSAGAIAAIAADPGRVRDAVAAAVAAAPDQADAIVARVSRAFPYYANAIAAAAGRPVPPASVAYAPSLPPAPVPQPRAYRAPAAPPADGASAAQAIAAIAANPAGLEQTVAAAVARAPGRKAQLVAEISRAYPLFAGRIAAAAEGTPAQPAPPATAAAPAKPKPKPAPAATGDEEDLFADSGGLAPPGQETVEDPLEDLNRTILDFNDGIDTILFRPAAWLYNALVPDPLIAAIGRAFKNLHAPVLLANDLLQADFEDAAVTTGRFVVNSTGGVLGLFDLAEEIGLPAHYADFGQTLHSYGVGPGAYVMLPLLGPSTVRDGIGRGVDFLLDPLTWLVPRPESYYLLGADTVVKRQALLEPLDELKASAIDYYSSLRSAYYQTRAVELRKGRAALDTGAGTAPAGHDADALFDEAK